MVKKDSKVGAKLESPISEQINIYLEHLSEIVASGDNLIENFDQGLVDDFKRDFHYHSIHNKWFMYDMVNNLISKLLTAKKGGPFFKKPLKHTFNIDYSVRDTKAGITIPKSLSLNLQGKMQSPELIEKYPHLEGLEHTVQTLMENTSDTDFTLSNIHEFGSDRYKNIKIIKSYCKITPEFTNKFKRTEAFKRSQYPLWMEYRVKSPESLADKIFDIIYDLDKKFMTPLAYEKWSVYRMRKHPLQAKNHIMILQEEGFNQFRIRKKKGVISDENAIRIITPEESYMHAVSKAVIDMCNLKKDDVKAYLASIGTMKDNLYESIHLHTSGGEMQIRTAAMNYKAEHEASDHDKMKILCARRRWHYMQINPKAKEVMKHLNQMFNEPLYR